MADTYTMQRIPVMGTPQQRNGSSLKDLRMVNCFIENTKDGAGQVTRQTLVQRGGLTYQNSTATGLGRGIYYYNSSVFSVVGNQLYRNATAVQTLSTSTGAVGFVEYAGLLPYLIVLDGTSGWRIDNANVITQITDADFPTPHCVHAAYLDGYLLVAKAGTADIYNSNLDDPMTWQAGNFITAEMYPDNVVALCRQNNYVVAMGSQTIEYFYNAGTSPGTPLARNPAAFHQMGTPAADSMISIEEQILFVGQTQAGGRTVWVMDGFNPIEIGIEPVRTSLDAEGTNISNAKAFCVRNKGHRFYVINLTSRTWVFDFEERSWCEWADYTGASKFQCDYASDHPSGSPFMQERNTGFIHKMDASSSIDSTGVATTSNITSIAVTPKFDFGTMGRKFLHRFTLLCDVPAGNNATSMLLEWTDDDYQTYQASRTIVISDTMPTIMQLGSFRRRAFKLTYSQPYPLRLDGVELDLNIGTK